MELDDSRERPAGPSLTNVSDVIASRAVRIMSYIDQNTYSGVLSVRILVVFLLPLLGNGGDIRGKACQVQGLVFFFFFPICTWQVCALRSALHNPHSTQHAHIRTA
jgi:hypothetical protein